MFNFKFLTAGATSLALLASAAMSETVIRLQSVLPVSGDEVRMVEDFAKSAEALVRGREQVDGGVHGGQTQSRGRAASCSG